MCTDDAGEHYCRCGRGEQEEEEEKDGEAERTAVGSEGRLH